MAENLDNLTLKKEYFYVNSRHLIPPYHSDLKKTGIDVEIALSLVDGALEETIEELEILVQKTKNDSVKKKAEKTIQKITDYKKQSNIVPRQTKKGKRIIPFPIWCSLYIGTEGINPSCYGGDNGITMSVEREFNALFDKKAVPFSEELMKEYEMVSEEFMPGRVRITSPNGWFDHNMNDPILRIFYKNLVIAINNDVVRKKFEK